MRLLATNWHDGPLQSWYDVHEAILRDMSRLRDAADSLSLDTLSDFTRQFQFFFDVLQTHSLHEDGVAFPYMVNHGIDVPECIRKEHHRELNLLYDIRTELAALHALSDEQDIHATIGRIHTQLAALEEQLRQHIEYEDTQLIPAFEAHLDTEQQKDMVTRLVGETPAWIAPAIMGWMFSNISEEHGIHLLKAWQTFLPADVFAHKVDGIKDGVSAERWRALSAGLSARP